MTLLTHSYTKRFPIIWPVLKKTSFVCHIWLPLMTFFKISLPQHADLIHIIYLLHRQHRQKTVLPCLNVQVWCKPICRLDTRAPFVLAFLLIFYVNSLILLLSATTAFFLTNPTPIVSLVFKPIISSHHQHTHTHAHPHLSLSFHLSLSSLIKLNLVPKNGPVPSLSPSLSPLPLPLPLPHPHPTPPSLNIIRRSTQFHVHLRLHWDPRPPLFFFLLILSIFFLHSPTLLLLLRHSSHSP